MAETVSSVVDRGSAPSVGTRRAVLLKPTMPCSAAGIRIEPPVSEPSPTQAAPALTDVAAPDDEPPGTRAGPAPAAGLPGVPWCGLMPTPENANSDMLLRAMNAAPARRKRAIAGASAAAAGAAASTVEPAAVTSPATSNKSFTDTARPASGPSSLPLATAASAAAATARADSKLVARNALAQAGERAASMARSICACAGMRADTMSRRASVRSCCI